MINILELALPVINTVIDSTTGNFKFRTFKGQTKNKIGIMVPTYSDWVECRGCVQPVARSRYDQLGLDRTKNYINAWGSCLMDGINVQNQPDQILWRNKLWIITTVNEWNPHNGWVNVTAVEDKRYDDNLGR